MGCFSSSEDGDIVILPPKCGAGIKTSLHVERCSFSIFRSKDDHSCFVADISTILAVVKSQASAGRRFSCFFCPPDSRPIDEQMDTVGLLLFHIDESITLPIITEIVSVQLKIKDKHFFTSDKKIVDASTSILESTLKEWGMKGYKLSGVIDPPVIKRAEYGILDSAEYETEVHLVFQKRESEVVSPMLFKILPIDLLVNSHIVGGVTSRISEIESLLDIEGREGYDLCSCVTTQAVSAEFMATRISGFLIFQRPAPEVGCRSVHIFSSLEQCAMSRVSYPVAQKGHHRLGRISMEYEKYFGKITQAVDAGWHVASIVCMCDEHRDHRVDGSLEIDDVRYSIRVLFSAECKEGSNPYEDTAVGETTTLLFKPLPVKTVDVPETPASSTEGAHSDGEKLVVASDATKKVEDESVRLATDEEAKKKQAAADEEAKKKQAAADEEAKKKQAAADEEAKKKQAAADEEAKKNLAAADEEAKKKQAAADEEAKKKQAAAAAAEEEAKKNEVAMKMQAADEEETKKNHAAKEEAKRKEATAEEESKPAGAEAAKDPVLEVVA